MKKALTCVGLAVLLSACGHGSNKASANNTANSSTPSPASPGAPTPPSSGKSGPFGPLTAAETALVGTDTNANGVRDDVESWIAKTYPDEPSRQAAMQNAQWMTWAMLRGSRGQSSTGAELNRMQTTQSCMFERSAVLGDKAPTTADTRAMIFNTYARTKAYLVWDASTSGTPSESPNQPCDHVSEVPAV